MSENYEVSQSECMILPYFVPSVDLIHPACVTPTTQIIFFSAMLVKLVVLCNTSNNTWDCTTTPDVCMAL
jgi:hypothetical protein